MWLRYGWPLVNVSLYVEGGVEAGTSTSSLLVSSSPTSMVMGHPPLPLPLLLLM
jgi:hypothetical protein